MMRHNADGRVAPCDTPTQLHQDFESLANHAAALQLAEYSLVEDDNFVVSFKDIADVGFRVALQPTYPPIGDALCCDILHPSSDLYQPTSSTRRSMRLSLPTAHGGPLCEAFTLKRLCETLRDMYPSLMMAERMLAQSEAAARPQNQHQTENEATAAPIIACASAHTSSPPACEPAFCMTPSRATRSAFRSSFPTCAGHRRTRSEADSDNNATTALCTDAAASPASSDGDFAALLEEFVYDEEDEPSAFERDLFEARVAWLCPKAHKQGGESHVDLWIDCHRLNVPVTTMVSWGMNLDAGVKITLIFGSSIRYVASPTPPTIIVTHNSESFYVGQQLRQMLELHLARCWVPNVGFLPPQPPAGATAAADDVGGRFLLPYDAKRGFLVHVAEYVCAASADVAAPPAAPLAAPPLPAAAPSLDCLGHADGAATAPMVPLADRVPNIVATEHKRCR